MDMFVDFDLCGSGYDTKIFVYENMETPGAPYACNDDFYSGDPCGTWVSLIENLPIFAGNTYYIVVDGYFGDCGDYIFEAREYEVCIVDCWTDAVDEGEPPIVNDYEDMYNGGCNSAVPVFQDINWANEDGGAWLCGKSGQFSYFGASYRDTDWFPVVADGYQIDWYIESQMPVSCFVIIPDYTCAFFDIPYSFGADCGIESSLSFATNPGEEYWLWVGSSTFGAPAMEWTYFMRVYGIVADVIGTEQTTMGTLKNLYK
jgi:hypothetical protein